MSELQKRARDISELSNSGDVAPLLHTPLFGHYHEPSYSVTETPRILGLEQLKVDVTIDPTLRAADLLLCNYQRARKRRSEDPN